MGFLVYHQDIFGLINHCIGYHRTAMMIRMTINNIMSHPFNCQFANKRPPSALPSALLSSALSYFSFNLIRFQVKASQLTVAGSSTSRRSGMLFAWASFRDQSMFSWDWSWKSEGMSLGRIFGWAVWVMGWDWDWDWDWGWGWGWGWGSTLGGESCFAGDKIGALEITGSMGVSAYFTLSLASLSSGNLSNLNLPVLLNLASVIKAFKSIFFETLASSSQFPFRTASSTKSSVTRFYAVAAISNFGIETASYWLGFRIESFWKGISIVLACRVIKKSSVMDRVFRVVIFWVYFYYVCWITTGFIADNRLITDIWVGLVQRIDQPGNKQLKNVD